MFRNKEFKQFVLWYVLIASTAVVLGFKINKNAGILQMLSAIMFGILFYITIRFRYRRISVLTSQIDQVLYNTEHVFISDMEEGELSILETEIMKLTECIHEQNIELKKEREHLSDSMADIAHQLRTPLTSLNLILTLLKHTSEESERLELIRETKELYVHIDWLLTSLLKLSRLDAGIIEFQKEQVEISNLIHMSLKPFLIAMDIHNIEIHTDIKQGIIFEGDIHWLSEAIGNVIKNCMESIGENGRIDISCTNTNLFIEISIHDNGRGFDEKDLPCLFERFYRGKDPKTTGYGIGLALARMIIVREGGTILAKNHPQKGALFTIRFPK